MSDDGFPLAHLGRAPGDPDAPLGYSPLGIAQINGTSIGVYAFQNGAKPGDVAGRGQGFADVFDSAGHLKRRFVFRENLNSPPQIMNSFTCVRVQRRGTACSDCTAPDPR